LICVNYTLFACGCSIVVEHATTNLEVQGLNPGVELDGRKGWGESTLLGQITKLKIL
jgi:hypothetical protein